MERPMRQIVLPRLALVAACVALLGGMSAARSADAAPAMPGEAHGGDYRTDRMIDRAFNDVLGRAPHDEEYRRYRRRVEEDGWDERDIKDDLAARDDYRGGRDIVRSPQQRLRRGPHRPTRLRRRARPRSRPGGPPPVSQPHDRRRVDGAPGPRRAARQPRASGERARVRRSHRQARLPGHPRARARRRRPEQLPPQDPRRGLGGARRARGPQAQPGDAPEAERA